MYDSITSQFYDLKYNYHIKFSELKDKIGGITDFEQKTLVGVLVSFLDKAVWQVYYGHQGQANLQDIR